MVLGIAKIFIFHSDLLFVTVRNNGNYGALGCDDKLDFIFVVTVRICELQDKTNFKIREFSKL